MVNEESVVEKKVPNQASVTVGVHMGDDDFKVKYRHGSDEFRFQWLTLEIGASSITFFGDISRFERLVRVIDEEMHRARREGS